MTRYRTQTLAERLGRVRPTREQERLDYHDEQDDRTNACFAAAERVFEQFEARISALESTADAQHTTTLEAKERT